MIIILYIINIGLSASLLLWPFALFLCLFMFDAPGSGENTITQIIAASILFYPLLTYYGIEKFWRQRNSSSIEVLQHHTLIGLISPSCVLLSFWALDIFCGGNFACR